MSTSCCGSLLYEALADKDKFCLERDEIAMRQDILLKTTPPKNHTGQLGAVKTTLQASNSLLRLSPDRQIQRIVRLTHLTLDFDLDPPDRLIYAILGKHPPYIGHTGCMNGPRSKLDRYRVHIWNPKKHRNFYVVICLRHFTLLCPGCPRPVRPFPWG